MAVIFRFLAHVVVDRVLPSSACPLPRGPTLPRLVDATASPPWPGFLTRLITRGRHHRTLPTRAQVSLRFRIVLTSNGTRNRTVTSPTRSCPGAGPAQMSPAWGPLAHRTWRDRCSARRDWRGPFRRPKRYPLCCPHRPTKCDTRVVFGTVRRTPGVEYGATHRNDEIAGDALDHTLTRRTTSFRT